MTYFQVGAAMFSQYRATLAVIFQTCQILDHDDATQWTTLANRILGSLTSTVKQMGVCIITVSTHRSSINQGGRWIRTVNLCNKR